MKKVIAVITLAILGLSITGGSAAENIAALATNIARGAHLITASSMVATLKALQTASIVLRSWVLLRFG
jgi:hypothetical protein